MIDKPPHRTLAQTADKQPQRRRKGDDVATPHRRSTDPEQVIRLHSRVDDHDKIISEILKWKVAETAARAQTAGEHAGVMHALKILAENENRMLVQVEMLTAAVKQTAAHVAELAGLRESWRDWQGTGRVVRGISGWVRELSPAVIAIAVIAGVVWLALKGQL